MNEKKRSEQETFKKIKCKKYVAWTAKGEKERRNIEEKKVKV